MENRFCPGPLLCSAGLHLIARRIQKIPLGSADFLYIPQIARHIGASEIKLPLLICSGCGHQLAAIVQAVDRSGQRRVALTDAILQKLLICFLPFSGKLPFLQPVLKLCPDRIAFLSRCVICHLYGLRPGNHILEQLLGGILFAGFRRRDLRGFHFLHPVGSHRHIRKHQPPRCVRGTVPQNLHARIRSSAESIGKTGKSCVIMPLFFCLRIVGCIRRCLDLFLNLYISSLVDIAYCAAGGLSRLDINGLSRRYRPPGSRPLFCHRIGSHGDSGKGRLSRSVRDHCLIHRVAVSRGSPQANGKACRGCGITAPIYQTLRHLQIAIALRKLTVHAHTGQFNGIILAAVIAHMERSRRIRMEGHAHTHGIVRAVVIHSSGHILSLPLHGGVLRSIVASCSGFSADSLAHVQIMGKEIAVHRQLLVRPGPEEMIFHLNGKILGLVAAPGRRTDGHLILAEAVRHKGLSLRQPVVDYHVHLGMSSVHIAAAGFRIADIDIRILRVILRVPAIQPAGAVDGRTSFSPINQTRAVFRGNAADIAGIDQGHWIRPGREKLSGSLQFSHIHLFLLFLAQLFAAITDLHKCFISFCQFCRILPPERRFLREFFDPFFQLFR